MTPTFKALTPAGEYEEYRKKVLHWWENEQLLNHLQLIIKHKIGHTLLSYNEIEKIYQLEHESTPCTEETLTGKNIKDKKNESQQA